MRDRGTRGILSVEIPCIVQQFLSVLSYLESQNPPVVHGSIRPECLLVTGEGGTIQTKVFDFGSTVLGNQGYLMTLEGDSIHYTAPEVLQMRAGLMSTETPLTPKTDVWGFGTTLLNILLDIKIRDGGFDACRSLLNGSWTFEGNVLSQSWWSGTGGARKWAELPDPMRRILQQSLVASPDHRLFASQLVLLLRPPADVA